MTMTVRNFQNRLINEDIFENKTFDLPCKELNVNRLKSDWVRFVNCTFICETFSVNHLIQNKLVLEFENCSFFCDVSFNSCQIDTLTFSNTKSIKSLKINGNPFNFKQKFEIKSFSFSNIIDDNKDEIILSASFGFNNVLFKKHFEFNNINNKKGIFDFSHNIIGEEEFQNNSSCVFNASKLSNVYFSRNAFNTYTSFKNSKFYFNSDNFKDTGCHWKESKFWSNQFNKVNFSEVEFYGLFKFDDCKFNSTTWFEKCKNLTNSKLRFVSCEFKGFSLFNKSKINFLDIDRCTFGKSSSFTETEFNTLKLFEVKFGGGAYFDEMTINKVLDKSYLKEDDKIILEWKRTLRAIKQESQKTENRIDFNNYRNYELAAHYKELKLRTNFKDTSILWATRWSSNFGNWTWAFWFTILSGLFWYSILYRIENSSTLNFDKINEFFVGAFRFFLVTDFFNPLENDRTYLENGWSWLIFILGKIFIAFGIYEMIQSFRKFKA